MLTLILPQHAQRLLGPEPGGNPGEGGVLLDAVLEEAVEHQADVTAYPVELGADINDHVILQPMRYTMTGAITDTPTTYEGTTYTHPDATLRSKAAWALLVDLMAARDPFSIDTGYLFYPNMVIEGLTSKKDAALDNAIIFEARLKQLNIVSTSVTAVASFTTEQLASLNAAGGGPLQDNGPTAGEEVTKTLPAAILDAITGLF